MINFRKKACLVVAGAFMAMTIAGAALAIPVTGYNTWVPGGGGTSNILAGTVTSPGAAYISASTSNVQPFNYALFTQGGTQITSWHTIGPGGSYQWSGVTTINGESCYFKVGTGLLYSNGYASGYGWD
jgi:hypothetical protein